MDYKLIVLATLCAFLLEW